MATASYSSSRSYPKCAQPSHRQSRVRNQRHTDVALERLTPLHADGPDLRLGDCPAGEWVYVRQPRYKNDMPASALYRHFNEHYDEGILMRSLDVPCVAERAIVFLYAEQNLLSRTQVLDLIGDLDLDEDYLKRRLADNKRPL